jgi:hypothetical protein
VKMGCVNHRSLSLLFKVLHVLSDLVK